MNNFVHNEMFLRLDRSLKSPASLGTYLALNYHEIINIKTLTIFKTSSKDLAMW